MTTTNYGTITFEGATYTLLDQAELNYRSSTNGWTCLDPNSWLSALAVDTAGNVYRIWWYIDNPEAEDGADMVANWDTCDAVEDIR